MSFSTMVEKIHNNAVLYNVPDKLERTNDKEVVENLIPEVVENLIPEELGVK